MANQSQFNGKAYNSFSGVDIRAVFGSQTMTELQAISWSVTREKAPIYTMGSADPRSFSRGKRGIAGTLIFIMFDRAPLIGTLGMFSDQDPGLYFLSDKDEVRPANSSLPTAGSLAETLATAGTGLGGLGPVGTAQTPLTSSILDDKVGSLAWYADQIPPFDVTLAAANEYGSMSVMRIFGVEIMNEGCGVSIDDIVTEQQHTYVARAMINWRPDGWVDPAAVKPTNS
jgi:hypothetical protein